MIKKIIHMKIKLIFSLLILTFSQNDLYSQSDATKIETFEWIKSKMNDYQLWSITGKYVRSDNDYKKEFAGYIYTNWTANFNESKCILELEREYSESFSNNVIEIKYHIPLEKIDPERIRFWGEHEGSNYVNLVLSTTNGKQSIKKFIDDKWETIDHIHIEIRKDNDIHNRMKKALNHLIILCGGKTEKF